RHTRSKRDWSSDVCSSDLEPYLIHMVLTVAAEGTGSDAVRQAVNELALRELNMEVDINMQTLGTLSQTLNMQMAANEELDVVPRSEERRVGKDGGSWREQ